MAAGCRLTDEIQHGNKEDGLESKLSNFILIISMVDYTKFLHFLITEVFETLIQVRK